MKTALLSNRRFAEQTHSWRRIWEDPNLKITIAFSLIAALAVLASLYMAMHYPLPEDIFTAPMTTT
jgi:hypothetical protein